jgi:hypothetical protein
VELANFHRTLRSYTSGIPSFLRMAGVHPDA